MFQLFLNLSTISSLSVLGQNTSNLATIPDDYNSNYYNDSIIDSNQVLPGGHNSSPLGSKYLYETNLFGLFTQDSEILIHPAISAATLQIAVEEVRKLYPHIKFNLDVRQTPNSCINHNAGVFAAEQFYLRKVDAFFGPACSPALKTVARMASYWNTPIFTAGGIGAEFSNKTKYASLVRISFSVGRYTADLHDTSLSFSDPLDRSSQSIFIEYSTRIRLASYNPDRG